MRWPEKYRVFLLFWPKRKNAPSSLIFLDFIFKAANRRRKSWTVCLLLINFTSHKNDFSPKNFSISNRFELFSFFFSEADKLVRKCVEKLNQETVAGKLIVEQTPLLLASIDVKFFVFRSKRIVFAVFRSLAKFLNISIAYWISAFDRSSLSSLNLREFWQNFTDILLCRRKKMRGDLTENSSKLEKVSFEFETQSSSGSASSLRKLIDFRWFSERTVRGSKWENFLPWWSHFSLTRFRRYFPDRKFRSRETRTEFQRFLVFVYFGCQFYFKRFSSRKYSVQIVRDHDIFFPLMTSFYAMSWDTTYRILIVRTEHLEFSFPNSSSCIIIIEIFTWLNQWKTSWRFLLEWRTLSYSVWRLNLSIFVKNLFSIRSCSG